MKQWQKISWWRWMWQWSIWGAGGDRENRGQRRGKSGQLITTNHSVTNIWQPRSQYFHKTCFKCRQSHSQTLLNKFWICIWNGWGVCETLQRWKRNSRNCGNNCCWSKKTSSPLPALYPALQLDKMFVFAFPPGSAAGLITQKTKAGCELSLWQARARHVRSALTSSISRFAGING